jgi:hypothetical protein
MWGLARLAGLRRWKAFDKKTDADEYRDGV